MARLNKIGILTLLSLLQLGFIQAGLACAGVFVYDNVTTRHTAVFLTVRTKGVIFPEGGRLVEFFVGEKNIGKTLSGGDGYGYLEYRPQRIGLEQITVRSDGDTATGRLLVMDRTDKALLIEIESMLRKSRILSASQDNSETALQALATRYRIIYLSTFLGTTFPRKWLAEKRFPESVVLDWRGSQTFKALQHRHINLYAIVASPDLLEQATDYVSYRYGFDQSPEAKFVENWHEVAQLLGAEKKK